jgi:hypothetical protein
MTEQALLAQIDPILEERAEQEHDRRVETLHNSEHYEKLSFAQKFGASRLTQYGYHLKFLRESTPNKIAIFTCEERIATIDLYGEIALTPKIRLRK